MRNLMEDVREVNNLYKELSAPNLKEIFENTVCTLEKLAVIKRVIKERLNVELYDTQLLTVLSMQSGALTEVKTGEGKSMCIAANALLESSKGNTVYIATTNDYLAKRDYEEFSTVYSELGIEVTHNVPYTEMGSDRVVHKMELHESQVIYTDCSELCFDYLRDEINFTNFVKLESVIIDEVDFILIDNAVTACNLIEGEDLIDIKYAFFVNLFSSLIPELSYTKIPKDEGKQYDLWDVDIVQIEDTQQIILTEKGQETITDSIGCDMFDDGHLHYLCGVALKAYYCYALGVDYTVEDGEVLAINRNNGRVTKGGKYEIDIQNALELIHGVELTPVPLNEESISYQVFYSKFKTLHGLSGTLEDAKKEFKDIFGVGVLVIPTNKPMRRKDYQTKYLRTREDKYVYLRRMLEAMPERVPKLIIAENDTEAERVFEEVKQFKPTLLNNYNLADEKEVLESAGKWGSLTISTPILGRGTDIKIDKGQQDNGLCVISLNHFSNPRIDLQVRGRSGRQGQPGSSYFVTSLEDGLWTGANLKEVSALKDLPNGQLYSLNIQETLDIKRTSLQDRSSFNLSRARRTLFSGNQIIENFKQKLKNVYKDSLTEDEVNKVFEHTYTVETGLIDTNTVVQAVESYYGNNNILNLDKAKDINERDFSLFFKEFEYTLKTYTNSTTTRFKNMDEMLYRQHTYANDYYMYYLKKYICDKLLEVNSV